MIIFKRNEDIFSFESESLKVIFSEPTIQAYDEYGACTKEEDILYYYYGVEVLYKKGSKWVKFFELGTYDFPDILNFKFMLEAFLNNKISIEEYQKSDCGDSRFWYNCCLNSSSLCEDYYAINHSIMKEEDDFEHESYTVTVGKSLDLSSSDILSVNFANLSKTDLENIYKCVKEFVEYSIERTHNIIVERNKNGLNAYKIENGKLYEMNEDKTQVLAVYVPGDEIEEVKVLKGDLNSKDFKSTSIHKFKIDSFTEDSIVLSSGYEDIRRKYRKITEREEIKLNVLLDLFDEVGEDKIKYNEEEIANDFISVLSEEEKVEFLNKDNSFLFDKWAEAIMNRTWMCREEHNLPNRVKNTGNHENVYASIREIIKLIKELLKK